MSQIVKKFIGADQVDATKIVFDNDTFLRAKNGIGAGLDVNIIKANASNEAEMGVVLNMGSKVIKGLATPVNDDEAATKAYVDSAIPAAGANTSLSNLDSVAVNSDLLPDTNGSRSLGSASLTWSTARIGALYLGTGSNTSIINMKYNSESLFEIQTGSTGITLLGISNANNFEPKSILIATGDRLGTSTADSGELLLKSGNVITGTSGNVTLSPGSFEAGGARGKIRFQDGSEGTAGHVWTSQDANGSGAWTPLAAGKTPKVEYITLTATDITNQYVTLAESAPIADSIMFFAGKLCQIKDVDWEIDGSVANQLNFKSGGDLANGGASALAEGDVIVVSYGY